MEIYWLHIDPIRGTETRYEYDMRPSAVKTLRVEIIDADTEQTWTYRVGEEGKTVRPPGEGWTFDRINEDQSSVIWRRARKG